MRCMEVAEQQVTHSGEDKKDYVKRGMRLALQEDYDTYADVIDDIIELFIHLSKNRTLVKLNRRLKYSCLKLCKK